MANGLAQALEDCRTIRRRFQGGAHFLQWPIPAHNDDPEVEKEDHPMCTKSLELNCDAVSILLRFYEGEFINVDDLKIEVLDPMALFVWYCFIPACRYRKTYFAIYIML